MSYDPLLAELAVRGEYTLAYESAMAARILGQLIQEEKFSKADPQAVAGRIAVLQIAQKLVQNYALKRVRIALVAGEDLIPKLSQGEQDVAQGTGEDHRGQSQRSDAGVVEGAVGSN